MDILESLLKNGAQLQTGTAWLVWNVDEKQYMVSVNSAFGRGRKEFWLDTLAEALAKFEEVAK